MLHGLSVSLSVLSIMVLQTVAIYTQPDRLQQQLP